jgi:hypothetical protein
MALLAKNVFEKRNFTKDKTQLALIERLACEERTTKRESRKDETKNARTNRF